MKRRYGLRSHTVGFAAVWLVAGILVARLAWAGPGSSKPYTVQDVSDCVAFNIPQGGFSHDVDIEIRDTGGKHRHLQARILGEQDGRNLLLNIRLLFPGNVAGTTVLVRERSKKSDDIRMYLPALERTRYISDAMSSTRLFDTDFSYADVRRLYGEFSEGTTEYLGIENWLERQVHMLRVLPDAGGPQSYASLITRIDTATCVILAMEFLDAEGKLRRQMWADPESIQSVDGYHLPGLLTMRDVIRGTSTTLKLKNIQVERKLPAFHFAADTFHLEEPEPEEEPPFTLPEDATGSAAGDSQDP